MGKVKTTWLLPGHSGRACRHEDIYTKQDRKTNKVYSVKLCNPNDDWSEKQNSQRTKFGTLSTAIAAWLKENKEANSDAYKTIEAMYNRQSKYSTMRGMMMGKGMAEIQADGTVKISTAGSASSTTKPTDKQPSDSTPSSGGEGNSGGDDSNMI